MKYLYNDLTKFPHSVRVKSNFFWRKTHARSSAPPIDPKDPPPGPPGDGPREHRRMGHQQQWPCGTRFARRRLRHLREVAGPGDPAPRTHKSHFDTLVVVFIFLLIKPKNVRNH